MSTTMKNYDLVEIVQRKNVPQMIPNILTGKYTVSEKSSYVQVYQIF
jgi:hypothetical protein